MELLVVVRKKEFVAALVNKPWEGPTNSSDNAKKIDSTVSEHDKALVMKNNLTTRVLDRPPPMSSSATSSETSSTSQSPVSSHEVFLRKELSRDDQVRLHLLVPKHHLSRNSMSYNGDVNVKGCAGSEWTDLYPPAQGTGKHMWAKANIVN
ncbi:hypothetical protein DY000_02062586 [Brassica cretica]|uniref:Uncharacterized protein n=1 Tax=Brassica cretica TaxID=69181 RepID=A0ABQ7ASP0_BRACR|nr:hypothetical protein DY000_02062586 [Brassica cretica]